MAKKIGNLAVVVSAETANLDRGVDHAVSKVGQLETKVASAGAFMGEILAPLAIIVAGVFSVEKLLASADAIDKTAKAADRLGMTTEALIGFHHGAELAGVGTEEFDATVQTMIKNVGLAAMGTGKAKQAIADLGLDAKKLGQETPENQLKIFADALSKVDDHTRKTALAIRVFGDEGPRLLAMMETGAGGLEEMQAEAEALGLTFSRVDAAKVEAANDAMTRVKEVIASIVNDLVIGLAPVALEIANDIVAWSKSGKSWREIMFSAIEVVGTGIAYLLDLVDYAKIAWQGLRMIMAGALYAQLVPLQYMIKGLTKLVELAGDYLPASVVEGAKQVEAFADGLQDGIADAAKESADAISEIWNGPKTSDAFTLWLAKVKRGAGDAAEAIAKGKPVAVPYSSDVFDRVQKDAEDTTEELSAQLGLAEKIRDVNFGENRIIKAGSAEAQVSTREAFAKTLDESVKREIEIQKSMLAEAKKTRTAVEKIAEKEVVVEDF